MGTRGIDTKIMDERLKTFAAGNSTRQRTVLIKLDLPEPKLVIGKHRRIGNSSLPRKSLKFSALEQKQRKQKTSQFVRSLKTSGIENTPLNSGTVIAKVNAVQLRDIAQSVLIKTIVPSRMHKIR